MPYKEVSNQEEFISKSCHCLFKPFVTQTKEDHEKVDRLLEEVARNFSIFDMEIFTLRFIEQKSYREIARHLGYKSPCPVQYHVKEIVRKLKACKTN